MSYYMIIAKDRNGKEYTESTFKAPSRVCAQELAETYCQHADIYNWILQEEPFYEETLEHLMSMCLGSTACLFKDYLDGTIDDYGNSVCPETYLKWLEFKDEYGDVVDLAMAGLMEVLL